MSYSCKNYKIDGGDTTVVGGKLEIKSNAEFTYGDVNMASLISAIQGDMILNIEPDVAGSSAATIAADIVENGKYTRDIMLTLADSNGVVHGWYNGSMDIAVTETTEGDGTSAIADSAATVTFVNGVAAVTLEYTGTWAEADTQTLTVTGGTILGYTITDKTSVDTITA